MVVAKNHPPRKRVAATSRILNAWRKDEMSQDDWAKRRIICDLDTHRPGPLLLCTAGIHGNEPAGGRAVVNMADVLGSDSLLRGRFLALTGNISALSRQARCLEQDLNRTWTNDRISRLRHDPKSAATAEEVEMAALLPILHHAMNQASGEVFFLDLHSTSGPGAPFACCMEIRHHRQFMESFSIPMILGLRPRMSGTLIDYIAEFGHSAVGVEGGQNDDPATIQCHEAVIRVAMAAIGMTHSSQTVHEDQARKLLQERCTGLPRYLTVKHRYEVKEGDGFVMLPGFQNFSKIQEGQVVARDNMGDILAVEDGIMLFPRYQSGGEDGFFLAETTAI